MSEVRGKMTEDRRWEVERADDRRWEVEKMRRWELNP
jgi:hypothetical protein